MRRTSPNPFIEVRAERLEGAPVGERRRWSDDFKDRAIAASLEPEANISALARSLETTPSQLFSWRGAVARKAAKAKVAGKASAEPSATKARRVGIEIAGAVVRVSADIAEDDPRRVLRAVREA